MSITAARLMAFHSFPEVDALCLLMSEFVSNLPAYERRLSQLPDVLGRAPNSRELWKSGMFDLMTLNQLILTTTMCAGGVNDRIVRIAVHNAVANSLVSEVPYDSVSHWFSRERILELNSNGLLKNAIIDRFEFVVSKYRNSVFAVEVSKADDIFIGTAFACCMPSDAGSVYLVTAKHNVDPADNINITSITNSEGGVIANSSLDWKLHPNIDLAVSRLSSCTRDCLVISPVTLILTNILTMGYPNIPTTDKPYLLSHLGEINAKVRSYLRKGEYILISNELSPGSSGSPAIDRLGFVQGVVTDAFESGYDPEKFPTIARAAIDASEVTSFIRSLT